MKQLEEFCIQQCKQENMRDKVRSQNIQYFIDDMAQILKSLDDINQDGSNDLAISIIFNSIVNTCDGIVCLAAPCYAAVSAKTLDRIIKARVKTEVLPADALPATPKNNFSPFWASSQSNVEPIGAAPSISFISGI